MSQSWTDRMIRAAKLESELYEEVEADEGALGQAAGVVVLSGLGAGVGTLSFAGWGGLIGGTISGLAGWVIWAYLVYLIGTRLLPEEQTEANPGQLLRTLGFASAPGIIRALGIIPFARTPVFLVGSVWMLFAWVVAVRQALDYRSTLRAVVVCLIGWLVQMLLLYILHLLLRG